MLKIDRSGTYRWQVPVQMIGDNGESTEGSFTAIFRRIPQSEMDGLVREDGQAAMSDADFVHKVLAGWEGLQDGDEPYLCTPENMAALMDIHPYRAMIIRAWYASISGAARKN